MSIWSKVLVGLVFVATLPMFYLAARLLKTNEAWRTAVARYERAVHDTVQGMPGQLSLEQLTDRQRELRVELHDVLVDRGRVWRGVNPQQAFNANTGEGTVVVEDPNPHQIAANTILYVFDPEGYLGEFQVTNVADTAVSLIPNMKMSQAELRRVAASQGDWSLHDVMPPDRHDLFAGLDRAKLAEMLPEEVVEQYAKDGQPAGPDDPQDRIVDGKYERPLTDFAELFQGMNRQIYVAQDQLTAAKKDVASLEAAIADAERQIAFHQAENAELQTELARSQDELALISAKRQGLEGALAALRSTLSQTFQENRRLAAEWAQIQLEAARRVENATARVPQ